MPASSEELKRKSPFPWTTKKGEVIVDERCECGALRSKHEDLFGGEIYGHGGCPVKHCAKFRWASHVLKGSE